jgi:anaerobic magnesium-protoporphyrin IX monomethyl ester cyclase
MRVLLVGPDFEENLSLRYLAAALRARGHEAVLAPFNGPEDAASVVAAAGSCELFGLSLVFQARTVEFLELAAALKAAGTAPIVAGGHFATCAADDLLANCAHIDAIVLHEGEEALCAIADAGVDPAKWGDVPGLVLRDGTRTCARRSISDLDTLPFPDRDGRSYLCAGVPTAWLMGSRGCVATCDYCCIVTLHKMVPGKKFRQRDPERVADEMAELYHRRGIRQFVFHDDNWLVPSVRANLARIDGYATAWKNRGLDDMALVMKCRPPDAHPDVFRRLRDLGLVRVYFGIESASEAGLESIGRKQTVEQSEAALAVCRELGISAQYTLMVFHPDATRDTVRADLEFFRRNLQFAFNFCRTELYAGTPLQERMVAEGRARGNWLAKTYTIADPGVELACQVAIRLFLDRCWKSGGVMDRAVGLDHVAAVARHFYEDRRTAAAVDAVIAWRDDANRELVALLGEVVDACFAAPSARDPVFRARIRDIARRERVGRRRLMRRCEAIQNELEAATLPRVGVERVPGDVARLGRPVGRVRTLADDLARHAAAVLLAMSVTNQAACFLGCCEFAAVPMSVDDFDADGLSDMCEESQFGTDPFDPDSDGDGIFDGLEDTNGDGVSNLDEQRAQGADVCGPAEHPPDSDTDADTDADTSAR